MQKYKFEQVHLCTLHARQSCIIIGKICWGDIIFGLIATLNAFILNLYCKIKLFFMI